MGFYLTHRLDSGHDDGIVLPSMNVEVRLYQEPQSLSLGQRKKFICSIEVLRQIMHKITSYNVLFLTTQLHLQLPRKRSIAKQDQNRKYHHEGSWFYQYKMKIFNNSLQGFESSLSQISLQTSSWRNDIKWDRAFIISHYHNCQYRLCL